MNDLFLCAGCSGQITVTQPPTNPAVRVDSDGYSDLYWYQQKSGEAPKLLINLGQDPTSEFSSRFSGRGDGVNAVMTISGVQADAAVYYFHRSDTNSLSGCTKTSCTLNKHLNTGK
uniref:Immunoglobulin V-set domain-containing protein n=1 Tax=Amphilophus citrinellus TaxID=61819 RepID=A0A3Q0T6U2_AMPCI